MSHPSPPFEMKNAHACTKQFLGTIYPEMSSKLLCQSLSLLLSQPTCEISASARHMRRPGNSPTARIPPPCAMGNRIWLNRPHRRYWPPHTGPTSMVKPGRPSHTRYTSRKAQKDTHYARLDVDKLRWRHCNRTDTHEPDRAGDADPCVRRYPFQQCCELSPPAMP